MYSRDTTAIAPICPNCAKLLRHPRIVLQMGSRLLYSYYCEDCGEAITPQSPLDKNLRQRQRLNGVSGYGFGIALRQNNAASNRA